MTDIPQSYVPVLRWKQGEYQAVLRSSEEVLDFIVPLIEVPEMGYDFEKQAPAKSIDDHVGPIAKRIHDKLGPRPCFVDMRHIDPGERMQGGYHPAMYVFDGLRDAAVPAIPTFALRQDDALFKALKAIVENDRRGACLRAKLEEVASVGFEHDVNEVLAHLVCSPEECDLILDLDAPSYTPIEGFVKLLTQLIARIPHLAAWRSFTLTGASFPSTTAEITRGLSAVDRNEWKTYCKLVNSLRASELRLPRFGDYGIAHPALVQMDMRLVKPNATLRYTVDGSWLVAKGHNVRDHRFNQYRELCRMILKSGCFEGAGYSVGDRYIEDCASGAASTGNLTTWRWVGTNHHLARVVKDVSSLNETSSSL